MYAGREQFKAHLLRHHVPFSLLPSWKYRKYTNYSTHILTAITCTATIYLYTLLHVKTRR